jgi:hypothetical protein
MPSIGKRYFNFGTIIFLIGLILFAYGGVNAYSAHNAANTHQYTTTQINESTAAQFPQERVFQYEDLPEPDQSIVEQTLNHGGDYTTSKEASEFTFNTDVYQANVVEYENEHYRLVAESAGSGLGLYLWIPFTLVGAWLLFSGLLLSPLPQRLREHWNTEGGSG